MTYQEINFTNLFTDLNNWKPSSDLPKEYTQFTKAQFKRLLWKRAEDTALNSCCRLVGKRLYVNVPMFALWMAGELPLQKEAAKRRER
ncbi:hypothetical protein [Litorilituus lipolyticus]|uniref:Uncharacterized protein n=1 Tax=Litorilituus lipolyticus TaxID=2491017 RepID=A0A502LEU6_9GAMM|nr:hypothetical protein [Litorilituus lipolyticus]TPH18497.1 hypothetical protein EPA86_01665 [Litorilituus lipolyticus]